MKSTASLFAVAASICLLWVAGAPALAEEGCGCSRSMLRFQEKMLKADRDGQIDVLRDSTEEQEDQLRCWYKAERAALDAEYDRARRCLSGSARRELARDHDDREDALRRYYWQQRVTLTKGRNAAESQIRDLYRQMERSLECGVVPVHFTRESEVIAAPLSDLGSPAERIPVPPPADGPTPAPTLAPKLVPKQVP